MKALDFPNNIQIETTSRCNATCGFCPYPEVSKTQPQGAMDQDLFERLIDEISWHRVQLLQPFLNNDPLMDPQIVPRLELMIRKNPRTRICVTTNGSLLRPPVARALAAMPLETIHISSNGLTPGVYRETMGLDAWAILQNVNILWDELRRRGSKTRLVVTAILMKQNQREVERMRDYWRARGVEFFLNPLNDRAGNITTEKYVQLLPFSNDLAQSQFQETRMTSCASIYSFLGILWNGDTVTCCQDWRRTHMMGNLRSTTIYELWHGVQYRRMRSYSDQGRLDELPLCSDCGSQRFSVDAGALRDMLARQNGNPDDWASLEFLESLKGDDSVVKQNLVRT